MCDCMKWELQPTYSTSSPCMRLPSKSISNDQLQDFYPSFRTLFTHTVKRPKLTSLTTIHYPIATFLQTTDIWKLYISLCCKFMYIWVYGKLPQGLLENIRWFYTYMLKCSLQWQAGWDDSMEKWCYYYNCIAFLFFFILLENIFISILFSLSLWHCAAFLCSLVMLCKFNYSYRILITVHIISSHLILTAVLLLRGSAYQTEFDQ